MTNIMSVVYRIFAKVPKEFKILVKTKYKLEFYNAIKDSVVTPEGLIVPNVVPSIDNMLNAFTIWGKVKVVIIGQDPYPNENAHGYAFSSLTGMPISIKNIYKCLLKSKLIEKIPDSANLSSWADQGVLLLNTALTCIKNQPGSHIDNWKSFTSSIITELDDHNIVFILLGGPAIKLKSKLKNAKVLTWGHPSPVNTINNDESNPKSFINCTVFTETNEYLESKNITPIDWNSVNW